MSPERVFKFQGRGDIILVLCRKKAERILIGRDVFITIVSITGDRVRLGITAPEHVSIDREEVFLTKLSETEKE